MLEVKFCVKTKNRRPLWWNSTAATFLENYGQHSTFTTYAAAKAVAKEHNGKVVSSTNAAIRVIELRPNGGDVLDVIVSAPTNAGKIPAIIVRAIEHALARKSLVEVTYVNYKEN